MSKSQNTAYTSESIKLLRGLDAVRKRPGMYIGDTDDEKGSGLHQMVYEVVDNAIDEALAGHCDKVQIIINRNNSVTVRDNGRGIPVDIHEEEGVSAAEVIMTHLHAGGKFDNNSYKVSGGLHGVGVSVVNALSLWLELVIWRDGKEHYVKFNDGIASEPLKVVNESVKKKGTQVTFMPSQNIFASVNFNYSILRSRLRELSFLNSGVKIELSDLREEQEEQDTFCYEGGIQEYVKYIDKSKVAMHDPISVIDERDSIAVEIAMQWNNSYQENMLCFTNNIRQRDGGTHLIGFRAAMTRTINGYIQQNNLQKRGKVALVSEDIREGLTCVLSVKVPDPKFSSQTKDKLVSSEVRPVVESVVSDKLAEWLEEHPKEARELVQKIMDAATAREASRKAREVTRQKNTVDIATSGKLAHAASKDPTICELILVEGDSAGGPAKQGRDRNRQAILPLRGKILNVARTRLDKVLAYEEIGTIVTALGTGIGEEDFDLEKLRYHKTIIMTDADVDGAHIRTLLLTFFYRFMPQLITGGYLYIARPPLYRVKKGKSAVYVKDERELQNHLMNDFISTAVLISNGVERAGKDLRTLFVKMSKFQSAYDALHSDIDSDLFSIALLSGYIKVVEFYEASDNEGTEVNFDKKSIEQSVCDRCMVKEFNPKVSWSCEIDKSGNLIASRTESSVVRQYRIDRNKITISQWRHMNDIITPLEEIFEKPAKVEVRLKGEQVDGITPIDIMNKVMNVAKKGLYIQRFKGLGEMNADQLWDTSLNPETRVLLQVKIEDAEEADQVFNTLMGEVVTPRREFIQKNALHSNIDA